MSKPLLSINGLSKRYGDFYALKEISMSVKTGTIHGVIGPNGAGKTTFFNCIAGTSPASDGSILLQGRSIEKKAQYMRPRLGIARSFQVTSLFLDLSVLENLSLASQALNARQGFVFWKKVRFIGSQRDLAESVLERLGLSEQVNTEVKALSHGEQRLLEVGMALMAKPRLLLLDEPTSGMGLNDVPVMIELIKSLRDECTVLLIEHNIHLVTQVCDLVTVLQSGQVIAEATPELVSQDPLVKTAYLGEGL